MSGKRKTHPYADLFPMMTAAELEALTEDVRENGLRQPIVLYQGAVLDGRNRLLACEQAEVEPTFAEHEGDDISAMALVISLNVQRRDMTAGQRAIVAARALPMFEEAALKRQATGKSVDGEAGGRGKAKPPGKSSPEVRSREAAGAVFKVSDKSVQQAKALLAEASDLALQVEACALSLAAAYEEFQNRRKAVAQKAKDRDRVAEYTDAISSGEMTLEEAIQKAIEREREASEVAKSQADARRTWLKGFALMLDWIEQNVIAQDDEYLAWYTEAGSPGMFEHGITAKRVAAALAGLERARVKTFGGR